jgi:hypothetical protein
MLGFLLAITEHVGPPYTFNLLAIGSILVSSSSYNISRTNAAYLFNGLR